MKDKIQIGQAILVPFGRQGLINAFCVGFSDYLPEEIKAKKINKILDETPLFSIDYLKLLEWVANYYCCDLVTVLNAAIPLKLIEKVSKTEQAVEFVSFENATKRQAEVLEMLKKMGKCPLLAFEKLAKTTRTTIKKLEHAGCLKILTEEIYRNPLDVLKIETTEPLYDLEGEQQTAYEGLSLSSRLAVRPGSVRLSDSVHSPRPGVRTKVRSQTVRTHPRQELPDLISYLQPVVRCCARRSHRLRQRSARHPSGNALLSSFLYFP